MKSTKIGLIVVNFFCVFTSIVNRSAETSLCILTALCELLLLIRLPRIKYLLGLMLCVAGINLTVMSAASDLDPTFGNGGKVIWNPGDSPSASGNGIALQSDGKIVMVGSKATNPSTGFIVARFNANGSLDTTFGNNGWVTVTFGGTGETASSVEIQPDRKIVVGGYVSIRAAILRLNPNGTLDTTFDGDGRAIIPFFQFGPNGNVEVSVYLLTLKIANDGKIVFAGSSPTFNTLYRQVIGRLNTDGSPDTTFSDDGRELGGGGTWSDLVVKADGSIFLAGYNSTQTATARLAAKYNYSGIQEWFYFRGQDFLSTQLIGIAAQPDGKLVMVGHHASKIFAIRLNSDGTDDNSFDSTTVTPSGEAWSVAIQSDGKIVANISTPSTTNTYSLIRFNPNGSLDSGFGSGGIVLNRLGGSPEFADRVIIQPDGKYLLGGSYDIQNSFGMMRYKGESSVPSRPFFDYDGDGKADVSVFRGSENKWYVLQSSNFAVVQKVFAAGGDIPTPADYDGDGKTDLAIFRPSTGTFWYQSSINNAQIANQWGQSGDIPRPSDFDGDGKADFVIYRPNELNWYRWGSTGQVSIKNFGLPGDKPVTGDFDGDGKSDITIYRPSTGTWWYQSSINNAQIATQFGISSDVPTPADFDGDGKTDFAVYRPSTGIWYIFKSSTGSATIVQFGIAEDKPVAADYDGDGKADIAVFRPSTGIWYLLRSTSGFSGLQFGISTDVPTENAFVP
jgi:uncharacterized delta-60 repeat protein